MSATTNDDSAIQHDFVPPVHSLGGDGDSARTVLKSMSATEQADFHRLLADSTIDAIIAHRPDGTVIYSNQGAREMLGYSAREMEHLELYGWIAPDARIGAVERIERILHDGRLGFESKAIRKDGTLLATEVRCQRVDTAIGPVIVAVIRDVTERIEVHRTLRRLAYHDALTGLGNRAAFDEALAAAIDTTRRHGDLLGLAYIDLDKFKPINDRYGHAVGDEVLRVIGERLLGDVRSQDKVCRLGGDEFVVLLLRMGAPEELPEIAERFLSVIEAPMVALDHEVSIEASIGMAMFESASDDARSFLVKADIAMYAAKEHPQHPWLVYTEDMERSEPLPG